MITSHTKKYFEQVKKISDELNKNELEKMVKELDNLRKRRGRIFFLGIGGSAANCSHAVNDFRKLCKIESYSPIDNVSELTARINDEGWNSSFVEWLKISNFSKKDLIFVMSVGGGNLKKKVSVNIIHAIKFAKSKKSKILGIVGKKDGYARKNADISILVPTVDKKLVTPHTESFQAVIWHCLVSHPILQRKKTKW